MKARIVHCRQSKYDVYIGRALHFPTLRDDPRIGKGSILANPYKIGRDGTRAQVIRKYETYARDRMRRDPAFKAALRACDGKIVGCWCAPEACHGDAIARLLLELSVTKFVGNLKIERRSR